MGENCCEVHLISETNEKKGNWKKQLFSEQLPDKWIQLPATRFHQGQLTLNTASMWLQKLSLIFQQTERNRQNLSFILTKNPWGTAEFYSGLIFSPHSPSLFFHSPSLTLEGIEGVMSFRACLFSAARRSAVSERQPAAISHLWFVSLCSGECYYFSAG